MTIESAVETAWNKILAAFFGTLIWLLIIPWPLSWAWNTTVAAHGFAPRIDYWEALAAYFLIHMAVRVLRDGAGTP